MQQNMVKLKKDLYGKIKITWISRKVKTIRRSKARKIQRGTNNNGKQNQTKFKSEAESKIKSKKKYKHWRQNKY